ncbi:MAG: BrnA antitoxin family protein [Candidatus Ozemobacteraceae bacterium]
MKRKFSSNMDRIKQMKDTDIDLSDPDAPELDDSFFDRAVIELPKAKKVVSLRMDTDVLEWFKAQGKGYQTKMTALLRAYMLDQIKRTRAA